MATETERLNSYREAWDVVRAQAGARQAVWLRQLREEGWARFRAKGFPTTRQEDWRFTNLAAFAKIPFRRAEKGEFPIAAAQIEPYRMPAALCELVFVDGSFAPELSVRSDLSKDVLACSLAQATDASRNDRASEGIEQHLGRYAEIEQGVFAALNTALWEDGAYLRIRRGAVLERPVHLLYLSTGAGAAIATHPRTLIVAEEASRVAIVEDYVSLGGLAAFSNAVTELVAAENAIVSHLLAERENPVSFNVSTLRIEQARGARVDSHSIPTGGGLVRNNVHTVLNGEGAECLLDGLFTGAGHQHLDNYMLVEHAQPRCSSRQFYNGILAGSARGVFHGRIVVAKDAQKTDAKQTNRNLLLSANARIDTKPQLEIYADDVKCTHGATIGQMDAAQLFYLRARGIAEADARNLLLYAFAAESLDRMANPVVREFAETLIRARIAELVASAATDADEEHSTQNGEDAE